MVAMALLLRLPLPMIVGFGTGVVVTHNLLDRVNSAAFGKFGPVAHSARPWQLLDSTRQGLYLRALALLPWMRVILFGIGATATSAFVFFRTRKVRRNTDTPLTDQPNMEG
jgi:uncharacterized membrane protein